MVRIYFMYITVYSYMQKKIIQMMAKKRFIFFIYLYNSIHLYIIIFLNVKFI